MTPSTTGPNRFELRLGCQVGCYYLWLLYNQPCLTSLDKGVSPSHEADLMAQHIIGETACRQASLENPTAFAHDIQRFEKVRAATSILESVSEEDFKNFSWELRQFARFEGSSMRKCVCLQSTPYCMVSRSMLLPLSCSSDSIL